VSGEPPAGAPPGLSGRFAGYFVTSKLTPIAVIASVLLGLFAVLRLPREEEPQIKVPIVDVFAVLPGATPAEVENRLTRPMEKLLWEIPDVEYLYSTSSPGSALTVVRFQVGTNIEAALVRLNQKLAGNADRIPAGVAAPLVKSRTIDDVLVLAVTLHSRSLDHLALRRLAAFVATGRGATGARRRAIAYLGGTVGRGGDAVTTWLLGMT
jgi:multidrug efflux pump subunit AcrB